MPTARTVLRLSAIDKRFGGVIALRGVTFDVVAGEVHALLGENGAGKSTLMAIAAGAIAPDRGVVEIDGQRLDVASPAAAQTLGLGVVYQHRSLLDDLTVLENMLLGMPSRLRPPRAHALEWARARLAVLEVDIDPRARITELGLAETQVVEIAMALTLDPAVLVLDEPTEPLTAVETERLFSQIGLVKGQGTGVVYISHRLPEVTRVADRVSVLRDGEMRGTFPTAEVSEQDILRLIVGHSIEQATRRIDDRQRPALLSVEQLTGPTLRSISLTVGAGEIVGLAGVEGNGQRDLLRALAGLVRTSAGAVRLDGRLLNLRNPAAALAAGLVHLPADRHREGVFLPRSVRQNVALLGLRKISPAGVIRRAREDRLVAAQVEGLSIRTPSLDTTLQDLSGGNQQKVLFARSLTAEPRVLLADEPTSGVDVGARVELYRILRRAADDGAGVIVLSSDTKELETNCDRVLVFSRGQIVQRLEGKEITEEKIMQAVITADVSRQGDGRRRLRLPQLRRFATGDYSPSVVLALVILALAFYTASTNGVFFSSRNFNEMLILGSALVLVSMGQLFTILLGAIDLSIGPLTGLVVVVLSFLATPSTGALGMLGAFAAVFLIGGAVALVNITLVRAVGLSAVLATIATFIALQGVSFLLRPQTNGPINQGLMDRLTTNVGPLPLAFIVTAVLAVACEVLLRWTHLGVQIRAVGSDEQRAHRLGARVLRTYIFAFLISSMFGVLAGLMLAAQVGIGDASVGVNYTLASVTAVVLGGASIIGGRGSFVGVVLGALLLQEIITSTTFLGLSIAWQNWLPGILILVSAALYSRARGIKVVALAREQV